ncbi:uncharacterized protein TNCV_1619971 [Trichonephila clavipes]|nr:uncharacterized protein TNCV_1619971 [Trichonephila clavipes]
MRCIGQGLESLKTFCAVMSLPNPVEQKSHDVINNKLSRVMKEVAEESMKMAAVEEYSSSPDNLLTVSGDGTWKTRGHSSLIGVCTVIGAETGDGDTKTFNALSENKPYGDDHLIQKIECVGHVQKKMGTRLRKLKLVYSKKKLSDGKTIGGKGRLTDSLIDKLAHYYGNAIRCNSTSVKEMRKAIWAVWGHSCSTDDEPMHWFCPTNPNTWWRLHTRTRLSSVPKTNRDSSLNTTFCQSVTFHIDLAWHHCRRSCRCSGVKGSARKGRLDLRFASARCLEIVCGTIATSTSDRIVERVTMGSTSACRTILRSSLLVVFLVAQESVFRTWVSSRVHCSQRFLTAHFERSTWAATRRVDQPAVFITMIRRLSNSLNCEKCLLARLPGMFRLPKSSYNRRVIVPFMKLRFCACLYSILFLIVAPPQCV